MDQSVLQKVLAAQRNELTEAVIYKQLAAIVKPVAHRDILLRIASEEEAHAFILKGITGREVSADLERVRWFVTISRIFGLNFGLRLMENQEGMAQDIYEILKKEHPAIERLFHDEQTHEKELLDMVDEERLKYVGAVVLGLNDALVELVGVLAGLTLALQNMKLIVVAGLITGIAASLSMAVASRPGFAATPRIVVTLGQRLSVLASRNVVGRRFPVFDLTLYAGFPSRSYQCPLSD